MNGLVLETKFVIVTRMSRYFLAGILWVGWSLAGGSQHLRQLLFSLLLSILDLFRPDGRNLKIIENVLQ